MAKLNHAKAVALADRLTAIKGIKLSTPAFFNEFTIELPRPAVDIVDALIDRGVIPGVRASRIYPREPALANHLIVAATELNTDADMDAGLDAYRRQVGLYARAIATATGQPAKGVLLRI